MRIQGFQYGTLLVSIIFYPSMILCSQGMEVPHFSSSYQAYSENHATKNKKVQLKLKKTCNIGSGSLFPTLKGQYNRLSSNNDLLVRLLDSQNLYELQSTPVAETKRITVLKPSKMVDNENSGGKGKKNDKQIKKTANVGAGWEKYSPAYSPASQKIDKFPVQPTRIVVLKPSPGKTHEINVVA